MGLNELMTGNRKDHIWVWKHKEKEDKVAAGPDGCLLGRIHDSCRVCAFVLLRCFSCSHTVLPMEHSLGVIFFSSLSSCNAVFFFNSTCISLLIILV